MKAFQAFPELLSSRVSTLAEQSAIMSIFPVAATVTVNGVSVDRVGSINNPRGGASIMMVAGRGTETGGPATDNAQFFIQWSDNDSAFTLQTNDQASNAVLAAPGLTIRTVRNISAHRYWRVSCTITLAGGTSPTIPIFAALILGGRRVSPI